QGNTIKSKEALRMKQEVIDGLSALELPENPLDQLVNHFGERNVAELTGRTRRLIRDSRGRVEYKKRAPEGVAMHRTNVHEMAQFQLGDRKSTRLNSSHGSISYAVFCLKKKKKIVHRQ